MTPRSSCLLVGILFVTVGCGADETSTPGTTPGTTPAPAAVASTDVASTDVPVVEFPDAFPADVPIPGHVQIDAVDEHSGEDTTIFEVTGWLDGEPLDVAFDYESTLIARGYEITSRAEAEHSLFFVAENGVWYVSAGFFPDPVRNVGTSVGLTVAPGG